MEAIATAENIVVIAENATVPSTVITDGEIILAT